MSVNKSLTLTFNHLETTGHKEVRCLRGDEMRSRQTTKEISTLESTTVTHSCRSLHK